MRKLLALLLILCLAMTARCALAEDVESQLKRMVEDSLQKLDYDYVDDADYERFDLAFQLDNDLQAVDVSVDVYDDMLAVAVYSPIYADENTFEKLAVYTTLVNSELFYAQFRIDRASGLIICRSCNVIERVLPTADEFDTLLHAPLFAMEDDGQGIDDIISSGADPYDAFMACERMLSSN